MLQTAILHIVEQITKQVVAKPRLGSPPNLHLEVDWVGHGVGNHNMFEDERKESKVAKPEKSSGKRGNKVYCWFAQLRLVFRGKP